MHRSQEISRHRKNGELMCQIRITNILLQRDVDIPYQKSGQFHVTPINDVHSKIPRV
jgi:hypothetical protein